MLFDTVVPAGSKLATVTAILQLAAISAALTEATSSVEEMKVVGCGTPFH